MLKFKKIIVASLLLALAGFQAFAQQEYKATVWGAKSDGSTDNTGTIQRAIDTISERGGGTLVFYVGRYLTGAIQLKSNVTIRLEEAAVLVGSTNIYDYKGAPALVWAAPDVQNAAVTGKGVIESRLGGVQKSIDTQKAKGYLPADFATPAIFSFGEGSSVTVDEEIKVLDDTVINSKPNRKK